MAIIVAIIDNRAIIGRHVATLDSTRDWLQVLAAPPDLIANDDDDGDGHAPLSLAAFPLVRFEWPIEAVTIAGCRRRTFYRIGLNRAGLDDRAPVARANAISRIYGRAPGEARQQQRGPAAFLSDRAS